MTRLATSTMQGICALALVAAAQSADAQKPVERDRGALGRALTDSLRTVLTNAVADRAFPGAFVIVGDSKGVLAKVGVGRLDWAKSAKPDEKSVWDLASLTKVLATTTAMAQLIESGRVALDAPVQQYLPQWTGGGREAVTVRQLLTHSSGLPAFKPYDTLTHNPDSLAALLFSTPLERTPGEGIAPRTNGAIHPDLRVSL